ncbi:MAG: helix-turn-helix transcriptional regulator, partial [Eubacteriales bacterium]|nr:helix-turn-helix transcriptional regulator [Eubacteriales bacterium]
ELLRRKDLYVITLADRHYRGILIGIREGGEETAVYNLQILMSVTPELTLCYTPVIPDSGIDWHALFSEVTQAISQSLPLDSNFFPLAQIRSLPENRVAEDPFYRAKLHRSYAEEDYAACRELILQKLRALCRMHCAPNDIRLLAATSLFKLDLPGETMGQNAEERQVEATNRVSAAKTQKELFGAVNDYFTGADGCDGTQAYSRLVTLALREVRHRFSEPLTLQYMASTLKITPQYLNRLFTRELGMTYNDYLTRHRLEKACEMLKHRDLHINQIAQCVGYTDAKYFCTLFKRMLNITPGQYRAMSGGN